MFEWDHGKAAANVAKHGVSFEEAATAFEDFAGLDDLDTAHSAVELRRRRLARTSAGRIVVVAYTMRTNEDEEITRIISARTASRRERTRYRRLED